MTIRHARKPENMGIYCVRDLNPGTGEISLNLDLNSKTGEKSPGWGVHVPMVTGPFPIASSQITRLDRKAGVVVLPGR